MNQAVSQCSERRRALLEMIEHQQINRLPDVLDSAKCSLQMFCVLCSTVQKYLQKREYCAVATIFKMQIKQAVPYSAKRGMGLSKDARMGS